MSHFLGQPCPCLGRNVNLLSDKLKAICNSCWISDTVQLRHALVCLGNDLKCIPMHNMPSLWYNPLSMWAYLASKCSGRYSVETIKRKGYKMKTKMLMVMNGCACFAGRRLFRDVPGLHGTIPSEIQKVPIDRLYVPMFSFISTYIKLSTCAHTMTCICNQLSSLMLDMHMLTPHRTCRIGMQNVFFHQVRTISAMSFD